MTCERKTENKTMVFKDDKHFVEVSDGVCGGEMEEKGEVVTSINSHENRYAVIYQCASCKDLLLKEE